MLIRTIDIGIKSAFVALRLPYSQYQRSFTYSEYQIEGDLFYSETGLNIDRSDLKLMSRLIKKGGEYGNITKGILVWAKIIASRSFWQYFQSNICRTGVDVLASENIKYLILKRDFKIGDFQNQGDSILEKKIEFLNALVHEYRKNKDNSILYEIESHLPESFYQERVVMMSYSALRNILNQVHNQSFLEWHEFIDWIKTLPFAEELILTGLDL